MQHGQILFAAATGLRPGEWIALEHRDIDLDNRLVHVRRAFRVNRLKTTKTTTVRAVPLQRSALDALDQLPPRPTSTSLLFPAPEGSYRDLHNWRPRHWRPAQDAAGITPTRRLYDLRHTFATDALRAGLGTLELSRYMGTSLINIDRTYGHLARDSHHHAIQLLDDYSRPDVTQHTPAVQRTVWHPPLPTGYPAAGAANVGGAASLESYRDPAHPARRSSSSQPPRLPHADATACSLAKRRISSAREWMPSLR